jgi:two-component system, sensor histidine kinase and response regulator
VKLLVVEDDDSTADLYRRILKGRGHDVTVVNRGEQCLKTYTEQLTIVRDSSAAHEHESPYDSVILDYKLPDINGLQVAKEILTLNLHQRIIIVSAYASDIISQASGGSKLPMEVLEKPISNQVFIDTVEDTATFKELKKFDLNIDAFKKGGISHEQLRDLADILSPEQEKGTLGRSLLTFRGANF